MDEEFVEFTGSCPICSAGVVFRKKTSAPFRSLQCTSCNSAPRQRALWYALVREFPNWRTLHVHESSPGWDIVSRKLVGECANYTASQYDANLALGTLVDKTPLPCGKYVVQDLQAQTFDNEVFDIVITQDVFEHIFDPVRAISEIARTLRPGGATIMTVPVVMKFKPSRRRAAIEGDVIRHILPAEYHGNPVSNDGSLVTIDWGFDIAAILSAASGLHFVMQTFEDMALGIKDECNQVLIGRKAPLPTL